VKSWPAVSMRVIWARMLMDLLSCGRVGGGLVAVVSVDIRSATGQGVTPHVSGAIASAAGAT
jgi:hypothetical protein